MEFSPEISQLLIPFALLILCGLVQGLAGFGSGLVSVATLSLVWELEQVVAVGNIFGVALSLGILWPHRHHVQRSILSPLLVTTVVGVPIGLTLLTGMSKSTMSLLLGVVLTVHATWSFLKLNRDNHTIIDERWGYLAGLLGGMLSGAFNTSGPPVLIYASERGWSKDQYKSSLQAFFLFTSTMTSIGLMFKGVINSDTLQLNIVLAPAVIMGAVIGHLLSRRIAPEKFKKMVLLLLFIMGLYYLGSWIG